MGWMLFGQVWGQYRISGRIAQPDPRFSVYLSMLEEWTDFGLLDEEMILKRAEVDSLGRFEFTGNELAEEVGFYKLHFAIEEKTPVFMSGRVAEKNYFIFLFSNSDSLELDMEEALFVPGTYKVRSGIKENADVLEMTVENDQADAAMESAQTESQKKLIFEKQQLALVERIKGAEHGLLNLWALYEAKLSVEEEPEVFRKVADELQAGNFQASFSDSFEQYLGAHFYRDLQAENT
ncbi:MAG: hypothetical protein AAF570_06330, partial [Bacteroidota bacterium]